MLVSARTMERKITANEAAPLETALGIAKNCSPVIDRTLRDYGDVSIRDYGRELLKPPSPSIQPTGDFIRIAREMTCELLGKETAEMLATDLEKNPVVLTANHHGVDYFAQSVQGSLIFALLQREQTGVGKTALVLSCGNIPLDNITYPQGMLIYDIKGGGLSCAPRKMPIFSNKLRRQIVCVSASYTDEMIKRATKTATNLEKKKMISPKVLQCLRDLLTDDYGDPVIKGMPDYSRQATLLNHRIWKRLHVDHRRVPRLICLELEKVSSRLIISDLLCSRSLISLVLFDRNLRTHVFEALDGHRACWKHSPAVAQSEGTLPETTVPQWGTHFFWGISENGRKFSLAVTRGEGDTEVMRGVDNKGRRVEFPFNPDSLASLIRMNRLIPSVFTCFLVLSFARGVNCLGGYYQADYLPRMQTGFVQALKHASADRDMAETIERVPTGGYLSGMQTIMTPWEKECLIPAGPVEIIAENSLTELETQKILAMSVKDAHLASLFETIPDIAHRKITSTGWKHSLAMNCFESLSDRIVVK